MLMNTRELLAAVDSEISTLQQIRSILTGQDGHIRRGSRPRKRRIMSADARARIVAAQKKRWAAWKKAMKLA